MIARLLSLLLALVALAVAAAPARAAAPTVAVAKQSVGATGTYGFTLSGVTNIFDSVTTTAVNTPVTSATAHVGTVGTQAVVTENSGSATGYTVTVSCVDSNSAVTGNTTPITSATRAVTIPAANMKTDAVYKCTFTNTRLPTLRITKYAYGGLATGTFDFTGTNGIANQSMLVLLSLGLVQGATQTLTAPNVVTSFTESAVSAGWPANPASVTCLDTNTAVTGNPTTNLSTLVANTATLAAGVIQPGAIIECAVINSTVLPKVTPAKISLGGTGLFALSGTNGFGSQNITTVTAGVAVNGTQKSLTAAGTSTVLTEAAATGYAMTAGSCTAMGTGGTATPDFVNRTITLDAAAVALGTEAVCTFTNTKLPTVTIRKVSNNGVGSFGFTGTNGLTGGTIVTTTAGTGVSGTTQIVTAANTLTTITESSVPSGWSPNPSSVSCVDSNTAASGNIAATNYATLAANVATIPASAMKPGAVFTCTVTNTATPVITSSKTVSASPLVALASGQFYTVTVNVGVATTTAAILLADTLPSGITLSGTPTLIAGTTTGTLSGCPSTGSNTTGCSIASGVAVGSFTLRIPVSVALSATSGTNTANLSGGGDATCTAAADGCDSTTAAIAINRPPSILLAKTTANAPPGAATFGFTKTGLDQPADSIVVTGSGTVSSTQGVSYGTIGLAASITESSIPAGWSNTLSSATCTDSAAPGDGNATGNLAVTVAGNLITVPSGLMVANAAITCTIVNRRPSITLVKHIVGTAPDGGLFTLTVAGGNPASSANNPKANIGDAGTTGSIGVDAGSTATLVETAGTGTSLANYAAAIACTDAGGTAYSTGLSGSAGSYSITAPAASATGTAKFLTCTITNTALPRVTVAKQSIGAVGGFAFTLSGLTNTSDSITTVTSGVTVTSATAHVGALSTLATITETPVAGYGTTASCTDANSAGTGNSTPITAASNAITIPAINMVAGAAYTCMFTNTLLPTDPKLRITKTTTSGSGANIFRFALSGLSIGSDAITVTGAGSASGATNITGTAGQGVTITETSPAGWPANPVSASCVDVASGTPAATFGTLSGNRLSIPAANLINGADLRCTFTNAFAYSVTGRVFTDNGVGAGTANDGILNGGEAGIAGVAVTLTNCSTTTYATASTDGAGGYALAVPFATAVSAAFCVEETNSGMRLSTGASVGSVALPSATPTATGGTTYTYTRTTTPDRIAFAWNGSGHAALNFGDVERNRFAAAESRTARPGTTVSYPHSFVAATGGSVSFAISATASTPSIAGWSQTIYADSGCTGTLQSGATLLSPPAVPVSVTAGQTVCIVIETFVPAEAGSGARNVATVQASFTFTNASPALGATYVIDDITIVSSGALDLAKQVRNVTQAGSFGVANQAKSGETLEYRITYTNIGAAPIATLTISDITPQYTSFVSATAGTTPATLTGCAKNTPANPAPAARVACATAQAAGSTGPLDWHFAGTLQPGQSGNVVFSVTVD